MLKVTVIMPSFNVRKYIRRCVESVLAQTLTELEILFIDAGSSDGTLEILEEYAKKDNRITLLHSEKKSYGYQVNMGIMAANGEYIGIVETDDYILPDMYENLYKTAKEYDADYVKGKPTSFITLENGLEWSTFSGVHHDMNPEIVCAKNTPELFIKDYYLWTGIYKKKLLEKVRLNETAGAAFQDVGFLFQSMTLADKAVYIDRTGYCYRQDNQSASSSNENGFHYIVQEYTFIGPFLENADKKWEWAYYYKMAQQMTERFRRMALSGRFWKDKISDMEWVKQKLQDAIERRILTQENTDQDTWLWLHIFLKDAGQLYLHFQNYFKQRFSSTRKLFDKIGNKEVIIFGCGRYGRFVHTLLEAYKQGQAAVFCDNNKLLWNTSVQGIPVLSPDTVVSCFPNGMYVTANAKNVDDIETQLMNSGIPEKQIFIYKPDFDIRVFAYRDMLGGIR